MDCKEFLIEFQDYLAPQLDAYEQAIYLYIFRHSRMLGLNEVTIGFKSARNRMACGVGEKGKPMSEGTAYVKLAFLQEKGCVSIIKTTHTGRLLKLNLPNEIPGLVRSEPPQGEISLEDMDFFEVPENRLLLLKREGYKCFYTLQALDESNFVVEHVVSRPEGNNSYRNLVAASREANNKKGATSAEDFLRRLFRQGYLSDGEFKDRLQMLEQLKTGELKPTLSNG
ncbi:MAG: HNH endonuclease signature motif containing protein [Burkholderiaceae bacterium]|nr:HNH endonuclease signature motif containing protein [Burkholderiaceae bacterium]